MLVNVLGAISGFCEGDDKVVGSNRVAGWASVHFLFTEACKKIYVFRWSDQIRWREFETVE
jgi:hypothetical protein